MNCPKCNTPNSGTARFCKACGADCTAPDAVATAPGPAVKASTLTCLKCATGNAPTAKFCKGCGAALVLSAETAESRLAAKAPVIQPATHGPVLSTPVAPEPAPLPSEMSPSLAAEPMMVVPKSVEPPTAVAIDELAPMLAPEPVLQPLPTAVPCFSCATLNSPSAKFCKSCGVAAPSDKKAPVDLGVTQSSGSGKPQQPWLLWAGAATAVVLLLGGGAYWMFSGSSPVPVAEPTAPAAPSAPEPTSAPVLATQPVTSPTPVSVLPAAAEPAPGADLQPVPSKADTAGASTREPVASEPAPAQAEPSDSSAAAGPTAAEREAAARAKQERDAKARQQERDAKARQQARDKAMLDKTNRTLDDLLKN